MRYPTIALAALLTCMAPARADDLRDEVAAAMPDLLTLYRDLHAHPELSMAEHRTARIMADQMRRAGFEVTEKVGGTGVVAVMRNGAGPVVLLRADMDGLPVTEQTGLSYASRVVATTAAGVTTGVMHACGHDTHMASWIGAARLLATHRDKWSGTLVMIAQPGEETGEGAAAMLADGLYTRFPRPDFALAMHDSAQYPAGSVVYTPGYALANVDSVDLVVRGVGGHGAYPQATRDPIVLASAIVTRLQTLISRESNPLEAGVVTVGSFHAGAKHNIIPDEARLQITVRSYTDGQRQHLLEGIGRIAKGEAIASAIPEDRMPQVTVKQPYTPATFNDPALAERLGGQLALRFGADRVQAVPPVMAGEDFSRFRRADPEHVQSFIFWVGGVAPEKAAAAASGAGDPLPSLHSPFWAPDPQAVIGTGAEALAGAAMYLMDKPA